MEPLITKEEMREKRILSSTGENNSSKERKA